MVAMPILLLEGMLRIFDPWGIVYFDDMAYLGNAFEASEARDYYLPDGEYEFSNWNANIVDGLRMLPEREAADCQIVLLGDSVTFSYGVSDDETWSFHIASRFPAVQFLNTGITGYNSFNVRQVYANYPDADAYFYSVISNDWNPSLDPTRYDHENKARYMPYLVRYGNYALYSEEPLQGSHTVEELLANPQLERFLDDIATLTADPRVALFGFEETITTRALTTLGYEMYQATYPYPDYRNSVIDGHLNAAGNLVLADSITPHMESVIEQHCP